MMTDSVDWEEERGSRRDGGGGARIGKEGKREKQEGKLWEKRDREEE